MIRIPAPDPDLDNPWTSPAFWASAPGQAIKEALAAENFRRLSARWYRTRWERRWHAYERIMDERDRLMFGTPVTITW